MADDHEIKLRLTKMMRTIYLVIFTALFLLDGTVSQLRQYTTIMAIAGIDDGNMAKDNTQLIDLTSETNSCNDWSNYPKTLHGATGAIISNNTIINCGGYSSSHRDECYKMELNEKSWSFLVKMNSKRMQAASVEVDGRLLIMGGYDDNSNDLSSSEFINTDGTVTTGPELPSTRYGHCIIKLPNRKVMIIGGSPYYLGRSVIVYDFATNTFNRMPSLPSKRVEFGCAVFNSPFHNMRPVALAVGGDGHNTAEILDYTQSNPQWTEINDLPFTYDSSFYGARAVTSPSGQGAIVQLKEHLYELTCEHRRCSWTILPQKLKQGVIWATLLALPAGTGCD